MKPVYVDILVDQFCSCRLPLALGGKQAGWTVSVATLLPTSVARVFDSGSHVADVIRNIVYGEVLTFWVWWNSR
jgi:hypothetical protein